MAGFAARLGIETFVMDDGWFGERADDRAGLGDWTVNSAKFPRGLAPLIERVNELGMRFGLWVEPEMVNQDSDLYRAHQDWVYHFAGRGRSLWRNQLALNLTKRELPLSFRFHVAMAGALGVGGDLLRWSDAELAEAAELVAAYKDIRQVIQRGKMVDR